ncbi:MAG: hypothetical protein JWO31_3076, partial [Phycisphaerales bacterium]|nr:hypothetical protein [Phycisphaerales bacterium]
VAATELRAKANKTLNTNFALLNN